LAYVRVYRPENISIEKTKILPRHIKFTEYDGCESIDGKASAKNQELEDTYEKLQREAEKRCNNRKYLELSKQSVTTLISSLSGDELEKAQLLLDTLNKILL
jgi:hypothetical protein